MGNSELIPVECEKYERLCKLEGRVAAAQALIDNVDVISTETLCVAIGLDITRYKEKEEERFKRYQDES